MAQTTERLVVTFERFVNEMEDIIVTCKDCEPNKAAVLNTMSNAAEWMRGHVAMYHIRVEDI